MDTYGEVIDESCLDINNYEHVTYNKGSLGYYGQRTGALFAGYDDFTVLIPKFKTKQTCYITHYDLTREGSPDDAVFDKKS